MSARGGEGGLHLKKAPDRLVAFAVLAVGALGATALANGTATVKMRDACDAESFNAVIGPGTCVDAGNVTFDEMIASLASTEPLGNTPTTRTVHHGSVVDVATSAESSTRSAVELGRSSPN